MEKNIYKTESLCCTAEIKHSIVNQLYFNKIKQQQQQQRLALTTLCIYIPFLPFQTP